MVIDALLAFVFQESVTTPPGSTGSGDAVKESMRGAAGGLAGFAMAGGAAGWGVAVVDGGVSVGCADVDVADGCAVRLATMVNACATEPPAGMGVTVDGIGVAVPAEVLQPKRTINAAAEAIRRWQVFMFPPHKQTITMIH